MFIGNGISKYCVIILVFFLFLNSCGENQQKQLFIEQQPEQVEIFGKGFISSNLYERDIAISPDGKTIIYTIADFKQRIRCLVETKNIGGKWFQPKILNISGKYHDIEPFLAEGGQKLFFASNRPTVDTIKTNDYNIWYSNKDETGWGKPILLNEKINTKNDEFYPSVAESGNLYFTTSKRDGIGLEDIYISKFEKGQYQEPELLDTAINTKAYEFNAYINPEETLLVFSSYGRKDGFGGGDLYYSKKDENGKWSVATNMGKGINSDKLDYCPFIDWPRGNFYFTSDRSKEIDTKISSLDEIIQFSNTVENGFGNIYRIKLESLFR